MSWNRLALEHSIELRPVSTLRPSRLEPLTCWNAVTWFKLRSLRSRVLVVLAAFRGLRCAFRYGPVLASSDPSMARAYHRADRPWIGVPAASRSIFFA